MSRTYDISKHVVAEAFKRVKANKGAAGVDEQSIRDFEENLKDNLYKVWNRMSSGSYFPPPVRSVAIPKDDGKVRRLGIPTVGDRVAQMVVKMYLEPLVEPIFHQDSYGYRPGRGALDAVGAARERCWRYDWVIDLDIKGFFDNLDHTLVMKTVEHHTRETWILLYVERWLKAPVRMEDGTLEAREKGSPQGSVISPLLANLFMHYAFDMWMKRENPQTPFERYADDVVVHCRSYEEAVRLLEAIKERLAECKLEVHPEKTKIVYCKDEDRDGDHPNTEFDFLGYTFRPRRVKNKYGRLFVSFTPAMSRKARRKIGEEIRGWRVHWQSGKTIEDLARMINPKVRGWINYYGRYHKRMVLDLLNRVDLYLIRWVKRKYQKSGTRAAIRWLTSVRTKMPKLLAHWQATPRHV